MQKKLLFTFLVIILLFFIFSISSYANTDYSVYNKEINTYHLKLSLKKLLNLDIPDITTTAGFSSSDIYFMFLETEKAGNYNLYISSSPFVIVKYDYYGQPQIKTLNRSNYIILRYKSSESKWGNEESFDSYITMANNYKYLIFSDDILDGSTSKVIYNKTNFYSPLVETVRSIKTMNSVTDEIISILPVTLTLIVGLIGIRKAVSFTRKKLRNA